MRKKTVSAAVAAIIALVLPCFVRADDQPGTGNEAADLARQLSDAVRREDTAAVEDLIDTNALVDRLSAGVSAPAQFQAAFRQTGKDKELAANLKSLVGIAVFSDGLSIGCR